ncbi:MULTISPECIES: hypothetical protein [Bacillus]|uniref:hypothetical protein n=1 Tax=Bacillus TaxID=1386 RepID=UPI002452941E|nr:MULTISPECIES: hypothetical protein [Bacillus]MDH3080055.1 hypothetical protein [Bacillus amyloliquefaciens]MDU0077342.1 hypothetical protein [Bacillus sp. IG2]MDU0102674.1 hypothetical protein [Bacillus sp. IS1]MEC2272656.1 hypothetical protein [Bacillus velezensis]MED3681265.1 hypothetical protein [Bacillus velezensis]
MKQLSVSKNAFDAYINYFKRNIDMKISSLYNEDFVFTTNDKYLSFTFLDKVALVTVNNNEIIEEITLLSYEYFITDNFIKEIMNLTCLPPRLKRYKKMGTLRFKQELIENFQLGNFCSEGENKILWTAYNIRFQLNNDSMRLENLKL